MSLISKNTKKIFGKKKKPGDHTRIEVQKRIIEKVSGQLKKKKILFRKRMQDSKPILFNSSLTSRLAVSVTTPQHCTEYITLVSS